MRTTITITIAAALAAIVPAAAFADTNERSFTRDGETYVYTKTIRADGASLLQGRRIGGGTFRLVVAGDKVSGQASGHPVSFRVVDARPQATEIAAN